MKEQIEHAGLFWSPIQQEVDLAGGWEAYYKKSLKAELEALQHNMQTPIPEDEQDALPASLKKDHAQQIANIQALFEVYELLTQAGVEVSFIGLTHTMQQYAVSVIHPMNALLEQGKVEEAMALYHQPRHYSR